MARFARHLAGAPLARVSIHPPDHDHPEIWRQIVAINRPLGQRPDRDNLSGLGRGTTATRRRVTGISMSACDLHIHSRFSARSEEWLFRRFDFPDSYSDPRELYGKLRERGMDFVTITDHDTIDGSLEIADLAANIYQRGSYDLFSS